MLNELNKELLCSIIKFKKATTKISATPVVNIHEIMALAIIENQDDKFPLFPAVGETLCITHSAVSQMFTSLEKKQYIQRDINEGDKRQYKFTLTKKGKEITHEMKEKMDNALNEIITRFGADRTKELTQMINDLTTIMSDIQKENNT